MRGRLEEELTPHPGEATNSTLPGEWRGATPIEQMLQMASGSNTTTVESGGLALRDGVLDAAIERPPPSLVSMSSTTLHAPLILSERHYEHGIGTCSTTVALQPQH